MSDGRPRALDRLPKSFSAGLSGEVWSSLTSGVRLTAARADVRGAEGHIATGVLFSESRRGRRPRSVTMGKGKKRPWIQAKIAAAQEGGGGMSSAKSQLESDMRVLSFELGRAYGLRINTISAGALKSRAASAIGGARGEKTCAARTSRASTVAFESS